jgi:uncharacterized membrane protein
MKWAPLAFWPAMVLWTGGLAVLALIVAPTVFRQAPDRETAGAIFGASLRAFGWIEIGAAVLASAGVALALCADRTPRQWTRAGLLAAMILVLAVLQAWILPTMRDLQSAMGPDGPERARFQRLHKVSEKLYGVNLMLGLALIGLTAWPPRS